MATQISPMECKTLHTKTKTLVVEANFSPAVNDESTPDIQVFDSRFSRFAVSIIDTDAAEKVVSANIKVSKEADPFIRMAEAGIKKAIDASLFFSEDTEDEDSSNAAGDSPAYTHILFSDPYKGKTVAMVLHEDQEGGKKALSEIYQRLCADKERPENALELQAILDGSTLLKSGELKPSGLPGLEKNPAYTQKLFYSAFKNRTVADVLSEAKENEEKLRNLYVDLKKNMDRYPNNKPQMSAIAEGLSLLKAGALKKAKSSFVLYKCGPKANAYKEENELAPCTELTLSLYPADNSPFQLTIENFLAPIKKDSTGRTNPEMSKKEKYNSHDFRISLYDMISLIEEMKRQMNAFFYENYGKSYSSASDELKRRRLERKEAEE